MLERIKPEELSVLSKVVNLKLEQSTGPMQKLRAETLGHLNETIDCLYTIEDEYHEKNYVLETTSDIVFDHFAKLYECAMTETESKSLAEIFERVVKHLNALQGTDFSMVMDSDGFDTYVRETVWRRTAYIPGTSLAGNIYCKNSTFQLICVLEEIRSLIFDSIINYDIIYYVLAKSAKLELDEDTAK